MVIWAVSKLLFTNIYFFLKTNSGVKGWEHGSLLSLTHSFLLFDIIYYLERVNQVSSLKESHFFLFLLFIFFLIYVYFLFIYLFFKTCKSSLEAVICFYYYLFFYIFLIFRFYCFNLDIFVIFLLFSFFLLLIIYFILFYFVKSPPFLL